MWRLLAAVATGVIITLGPVAVPQSAQAQERISVAEGRELAARLYSLRQFRALREVTRALLQADPEDIGILILLARAEQGLGDTEAADMAATLAWQNAQTESEKLAAALTVAEIATNADRLTRAQFWLRRAANHTRTPREDAFVARAFSQVRRANPLSISLDFGMSPSDNVNNGTSNEYVTFAFLPDAFSDLEWIVPPDERPLSGIELSLSADLRYRLAQGARSRTSLEAGVFGKTYIMSAEAREDAPEVSGAALSYGQAYLGLGRQWVPEGTQTTYSASLRYILEADADGLSAHRLSGDIGAQMPLSETMTLSYGAGLERARYTTGETADRATLRGHWALDLANEDVLSLSARLVRSRSDAMDRDYRSATVSLGYDFGQVTDALSLSVVAEQRWQIHDAVSLDPSGREDSQQSLKLSAGFPNMQVYGFEPVVTLRHQKTESSVPSYDSVTTTMGLFLRSRF